ncbi:MAG TPA: SH3 domain-containing protein [Methylovirgula sp.]|nr:SH3 domain-containing protein [Methylovirgula sp.]
MTLSAAIRARVGHTGLEKTKMGHARRRGFTVRFFWMCWVGVALSGAAFSACAETAAQQNGQQIGSVSGLPLPRFVSLKSDRVNLREGPSKDHRTTWIYERAGLPIEITAEFGTWRKVRDSDGTEGWVLHTLLSGRRTAIVAPWKKNEIFTLFSKPAEDAEPLARLQPGVIAAIRSCDGKWCEISGEGFDGYIEQTLLWGVYPNEKID